MIFFILPSFVGCLKKLIIILDFATFEIKMWRWVLTEIDSVFF